MGAEPIEDGDPGARCEERHDVAGADDGVEPVADPPGREVELGQIADQPTRAGMVVFGRGDEERIDVDPDHVVADLGQRRAHPSGAAPGVEDAGASRHHGVDEAGFAGQVVTGGDHGAEPFHVPTRVSGVLAGDLDPAAWFDVVRSRFAHGLASVERPEARERVESR